MQKEGASYKYARLNSEIEKFILKMIARIFVLRIVKKFPEYFSNKI